MASNIKAIVAGVVFIVVTTLLMQLVFIFLAVAYNAVANEYSFLKDIQWIFKYLLAIPAFLVIMFLGGYLTASIAERNLIINTVIVGVIVVVGMMWSALVNAELTLTGLVISLAMITTVVIGGEYHDKKISEINN